MERGIKNWMFVSVALVFVYIGRFLGAEFGWHVAEYTLDGAAAVCVLLMAARIAVKKFRK